MTGPNWERVKAVFAEAAELDGDARRAFLDAACAADAGVRAEVEALLTADATPGPVDELGMLLARPGVARLVAGPKAGDRVGRYRVIRKVGEGGMGAVYEAERADPGLRQRVALKLVRIGFGDRDLLDRFLVERQILARLEHPNIARLLDGGLTDEGLPYYAMEYVEGTRIDRYAEAGALGLRARLGLFQRVCAAVQYAHQNLIVHRDLKPDNILVTADGTPKLLDFGIAKLLPSVTPADAEARSDTRTAQRRLTPEYASPEQIRGEPIAPASDVYSLGVLLYVLLAGRSPYRTEGDLPHELERIICEVEPERPSAVVSGAPRVARAIAGDLDTIVLKALRKDSALRYAMAGQLADDVGRYLDGLPVLARPDTLGYRARKFVRRHAGGVTAAALVLLSLVGGLGVAVRQGRVAARERDRARGETAKSQQVAEFLVDLFEASDPNVALGEQVGALELLERGTERLRDDGGLREQPDVRATMLHVTGRVFQKLGRYDRAGDLATQALELRTTTIGPASVEVAETLTLLGNIAYDRGDPDAAEDFHRQALVLNQGLLDRTDPRLVASLKGLALAWQVQGKYHAADSVWTDLLQIERSRVGAPSAPLAEILHNLGWARASQGDYGAAEASFREALAMRRSLTSDVHPEVAHTALGLASTLRGLGRLDEAEALVREALAIQTVVLGEGHPDLADVYLAMGGVLVSGGALDSAEASFRAGLSLLRAAVGEHDIRVGRILNDLGGVFERRGDLPGADSLYRHAWSVYGIQLGAEHPFTAIVLANVASVARQRGDLAAAERIYTDVLATLRSSLGAEHVETAGMTARLGYVKMERGDYGGAERLLDSALAALTRQLPANHARVVRTLEALLTLYERWGRADLVASYRARLESARSAAR
jgi:serine/threonine-protein kinase